MRIAHTRTQVLVLLALASITLPCFCYQRYQGPPIGDAEKVPPPDWMLYEVGFKQIGYEEQSAKKSEAKGTPSSAARTQYAEKYQLTLKEHAALVKIALRCTARVKEIDKKSDELIKLARQERAQTGNKSSSYDGQIKEQFARREPAIREAINEIATTLGDASAQKIYQYLKKKIAPAMSVYKF